MFNLRPQATVETLYETLYYTDGMSIEYYLFGFEP